ncbi:MAG: hypothetical protein RL410_1001 [Actinomycetota bacterium]|jgi:predicted RecB family nuclease
MNYRLDSRAATACHELLHKRFAPSLFPGITFKEKDGFEAALSQAGDAFEAEVVAKLVALHASNGLRVITANASKNTAAALLDPGVHYLLGAVIDEETERELAAIRAQIPITTNLASKPDLLVRMDEESWLAVDIKFHKPVDEGARQRLCTTTFENMTPTAVDTAGKLKKEDALQLAHYFTHLDALGLASATPWAGIIGNEDIELIRWQLLDEKTMRLGGSASALEVYADGIAKAQAIVEASVARNSNHQLPAPAIPMVMPGTKGCKGCGYKDVCIVEIEQYKGSGHVTLLAAITPDAAKKFKPPVDSIAELASCTPEDDETRKAQTRALAWVNNDIRRLDLADTVRIPRADIEIDIDLENSQAALMDEGIEDAEVSDTIFMYGYALWDRTNTVNWRDAEVKVFEDWSNSSDGEFKVLLDMWNFVNAQVSLAHEANKSIKIYHYHNPEPRSFKTLANKYMGKPGVPTLDEVEAFIAEYTVDMLPIAKHWAFHAKGYSIKDLAPLAKFEWDVQDPGGSNAVLKFIDAISDSSTSVQAQDWLRSYNMDDCRATIAVREWLENAK